MRDKYSCVWLVLAAQITACSTPPPTTYANRKHSLVVQLPGGVGAGSESEGALRPDVCAGDTLQVQWFYENHRRARADSPTGFMIVTCALRAGLTMAELVRIEMASFSTKGAAAKDLGSGDIELVVDSSVARLQLRIVGQRFIGAMVTAREEAGLRGPEAALFLGSARSGH